MRSNPLIGKFASGKAALNGWITLDSSAVAEVMAHQPWDAITIDMQHGLADFDTTVHMLRAISTTQVTPIVRVPWLDTGFIGRVLDAGAYGVICPMVNTVEQCQAFVHACRYAPAGGRSFGPTRAPLYAGADYWTQANEQMFAIAMIETRQALENLEAILAVPGLSGVYIGPADLSLSMGFDPIREQGHAQMLATYERIRQAAKAAGRFTVMHCSMPEFALQMLPRGFEMLTVSNDSRMLSLAAQHIFGQLDEARTKLPTINSY